MPLLAKFTKKTFVPLPSGRYHLRLLKVGEGQGKHGPIVIFFFEVVEGPFKGCRLDGWVNQDGTGHYGPRHKLGRWIEPLAGRPIQEDEELNLEAFVGRTCWAQIIAKRSSTGSPSNKIDSLEEYHAKPAS